MAIAKKYHYEHKNTLRDVRTVWEKLRDFFLQPSSQLIVFGMSIATMLIVPSGYYGADALFIFCVLYFFWLKAKGHKLPGKMPMSASLEKIKDPNNNGPGRNERSEGILYVGNVKDTNEEIWFTSNDIKTHILYLGTTGAGKTEGLKSLVSNALCWGSGYVYVDGKADTGLWNSLSALARRFGRDDDLLVLNYMTGNKDGGGASNTLNPFAGGSASYLVNLLVSLMPDAGGDNAMWKERAVSLVGSIMPALTWKRDNQEVPLNINSIRDYLNLPKIIQLSRDPDLPNKIRGGIKGYLDTLPGYSDDFFDDDGNEKPMPPDGPMVDTATIYQQHGYLSMQFTRSLQSLADDYGYVFETENADIDMTDVVLNRRMMVVLIPALEKSSDESANLGKIVAANIKGMMGSTLGADVEGDAATTIENKPSESRTPFITIFDEVGYYASQGMAVMAAQARSLGFCLVYAAQDLPAMEKRVKEEARSITANCNLKIFGKLEDPTQTKEFFEKTVGDILVAEVSGFESRAGSLSNSYAGKGDASMQKRARASYDGLRGFKEGQAVVTFGDMLEEVQMFYSNPGSAKAMRVQKMLEPPKMDTTKLRQKHIIMGFLDNYRRRGWTLSQSAPAIETEDEISKVVEGFKIGKNAKIGLVEAGAMGVAKLGMDFLENYPDMAPPKPEAPTPTQQSVEPEDVSDEEDDVSWEDLMGSIGDDDEDDNGATSPMSSQTSAQATPLDADSDEDDGGMGWGDIMGSDDDDDDDEDEAAGEAMMPMPPIPPVDDRAKEPISPPMDQPTTTGASPAQDQIDDEEGDGGMGWGDIMGSDDDDDDAGAIAMPAAAEPAPAIPPQSEPVDETQVAVPEETPIKDGDSNPVEEPLSWSDLAEAEDDADQGEGEGESAGDQSDMRAESVMPGLTAADMDEAFDESHSSDERPTQSAEQSHFDANQSLEKARKTGHVDLPEGLTPDVEDMLKSTAQTVTSGLFSSDNPLENDEKKDDDKSRHSGE